MRPSSKKDLFIIVIPYIIGSLWVLSHPLVSVITGESKCRGIYIDEHQLDPNAYDTNTAHNAPVTNNSRKKRYRNAHTNTNDNANTNTNTNTYVNNNPILDDIMRGQANDEGYNMCSILEAIIHNNATTDVDTDANNTNTDIATDAKADSKNIDQIAKMAKVFSSPSISCHSNYHPASSSSSSSFQVVKVDPSTSATTPVEALVIVIPSVLPEASELESSTPLSPSIIVQKSMLFMVERMAQHSFLAKTLLFVICNENNVDKTVNDFFISFNTKQPLSSISTRTAVVPLPMKFTKYLIRQLIVLDVQPTPTIDAQSSFFSIIPHGTNGLLPNLDLLTTALYSFQNAGIKRAMGADSRDDNEVIKAVHSFNNFTLWWESAIIKGYYFPRIKKWEEYGRNIGHLGAFMANAIFRPAPHAAALSNGIDSLTIRAKLSTKTTMEKLAIEPKIDTIFRGTEHLLRALNSLQELLHHNVDQYLMVSPSKFVSFDEYVLPAILILLPLVLRVVMSLFRGGDGGKEVVRKGHSSLKSNTNNHLDECTFRFKSLKGIGVAFLIPVMLLLINESLVVVGGGYDDNISERYGRKSKVIMNSAFFILYISAMQYTLGSKAKMKNKATDKSNEYIGGEEKQSLQILSCLLALYLHVPIVLVHISLGLISAIVWVPLLAFPSYKKHSKPHHGRIQFIWTLFSRIVVLLMLPPIAKNILSYIVPMVLSYMTNDKGTEATTTVVSNVLDAFKEMNTLSSAYICYVYIPLHFMLSLVIFS